jgi:hypothetical protein
MRSNNERGYYSRLMTADIHGENIYCLLDSGTVSHYDWWTDNKLLLWAKKPQPGGNGYPPRPVSTPQPSSTSAAAGNPVKHAIKQIYRQIPLLRRARYRYGLWHNEHRAGMAYLLLTDQTQEREHIAPGVLSEDGHCSFSPDRQWFVTDTYADYRQQRHLMLYHMAQRKLVRLGGYHSPPETIEAARCDLHPRWNRDGTQICIDSTHEGKRNMYIVDVAQVVRKA